MSGDLFNPDPGADDTVAPLNEIMCRTDGGVVSNGF